MMVMIMMKDNEYDCCLTLPLNIAGIRWYETCASNDTGSNWKKTNDIDIGRNRVGATEKRLNSKAKTTIKGYIGNLLAYE